MKIKDSKKDNAITCPHSAFADRIFTKIMIVFANTKTVWEKLQGGYEGNCRIKAISSSVVVVR